MSADRAVFRYGVPVDDRWHTHALTGAVLHVDCRQPDLVEVWALHTGGPGLPRVFRVFGTGQPVPPVARHVGTALAADGVLVWHLFEHRGEQS